MTPRFRVYTNPDLIGVEIAGATKILSRSPRVFLMCLGYGDNTKASLSDEGIGRDDPLRRGDGGQRAHLRGAFRGRRPHCDLHEPTQS